jgi:hypothetical protein
LILREAPSNAMIALLQFEFHRARTLVTSVNAAVDGMAAQQNNNDVAMVLSFMASPEFRVFHELAGEPELGQYCEGVGVTFEQLAPSDQASDPLPLRLDNSHNMHTIKRFMADGSVKMPYTFDEWFVLRVGASRVPIANLNLAVDDAKRELRASTRRENRPAQSEGG